MNNVFTMPQPAVAPVNEQRLNIPAAPMAGMGNIGGTVQGGMTAGLQHKTPGVAQTPAPTVPSNGSMTAGLRR